MNNVCIQVVRFLNRQVYTPIEAVTSLKLRVTVYEVMEGAYAIPGLTLQTSEVLK